MSALSISVRTNLASSTRRQVCTVPASRPGQCTQPVRTINAVNLPRRVSCQPVQRVRNMAPRFRLRLSRPRCRFLRQCLAGSVTRTDKTLTASHTDSVQWPSQSRPGRQLFLDQQSDNPTHRRLATGPHRRLSICQASPYTGKQPPGQTSR